MFRTLRETQMMAAMALVAGATMIGIGASRADDDMVGLAFENTADQDVLLEVEDFNYYSPGTRSIHLNRATIDGKPSHMGTFVPFKAVKKNGRINLKVTSHCGSGTDSVVYTRPSTGKIQVLYGCKLTGA
jgi:hypothetical protein